MKTTLWLAPLLLAGCLTSMTTGVAGATGQSVPTSASSGGAISGNGSSVASGSTGAGATSTGATSAGGGTGSSGTSGGSTSGGTGPTGGTTTQSTTGGCLDLGQPCGSNPACCSGSCEGTCQQGVGQQCLDDADCSSGNCSDGACACGVSTQQEIRQGEYGLEPSPCATDGDCCNGVTCTTGVSQGVQTGLCCNQVGGACQNSGDCCGGNCDGGTCLCAGLYAMGCEIDSDCCDGACSPEHLPPGIGQCLAAVGRSCTTIFNCESANCSDGTCGSCSLGYGACQSASDCCAGLTCASYLDYYLPAPSPPLITGACCLPNNSACYQNFEYNDGGPCCSGNCTDAGVCVCVPVREPCTSEQACCPGASCLGGNGGNAEFTACCQNDGQVCFNDQDCCSSSCVNEQCACVPKGVSCGPPGEFSQAGPAACCSGSCQQGLCQ